MDGGAGGALPALTRSQALRRADSPAQPDPAGRRLEDGARRGAGRSQLRAGASASSVVAPLR